jgi:hypothetical protein
MKLFAYITVLVGFNLLLACDCFLTGNKLDTFLMNHDTLHGYLKQAAAPSKVVTQFFDQNLDHASSKPSPKWKQVRFLIA